MWRIRGQLQSEAAEVVMKILWRFVFFLGVAVLLPSSPTIAAGVNTSTPEATRLARIVGGTVAPASAWPWQTVLYYKHPSRGFVAICGGALVATDWMLTAAHCIAHDPGGSYRVG